VALIEVADEWVLHDAETDELHRLDLLGAGLWARFDGRRSVGELIEDLADGSGGDRDRIAASVTAFLADLDHHELIVEATAGSAPTTSHLADGEQ
jgi:hypothetical protein